MRRWITVGLESHFGSSVGAPAYWLDCLSASLDVPNNPFIEIPSVRTRSVNTLKRGLYIPSGDIEMVLDRHKMGHFFRSMLGNYHCFGNTKVGTATALDGGVSAGDTTFAVDDVAGFAKDDLIQIGDDWATGTEVHKVDSVDTANNEVTLLEALLNDHADDAAVQEVEAPFAHSFSSTSFGDPLPSMEIRVVKDAVGGDHRFVGATVDTAAFNFEVNDVAKVTFGIVAQKDEMVGHWPPGAGAISTRGFGFDEIEYVRFDPDGATAAVDFTRLIRSLSIQFSNGIQSDMGGRFGSRFPVELPPGAVEVSARATLVFRDMAAYQWFWGQASSPGAAVEPTRGNLEAKIESDATPSESYFLTVYRAIPRSVAARLVGPETIVEEVEFLGTALIGKEVQIRLYAERLEVYYKGHLVERVERVRGEREANVNYRHIIGSPGHGRGQALVRKPGAFARYRFREQMFPTMTFRLAYDALKRWRGERADVEYVRILHLAATTMESTVDSALALLLEAGDPFDYATVKDLANPAPPRAPVLSLSGMPDLRVYDSLLAGVA